MSAKGPTKPVGVEHRDTPGRLSGARVVHLAVSTVNLHRRIPSASVLATPLPVWCAAGCREYPAYCSARPAPADGVQGWSVVPARSAGSGTLRRAAASAVQQP